MVRTTLSANSSNFLNIKVLTGGRANGKDYTLPEGYRPYHPFLRLKAAQKLTQMIEKDKPKPKSTTCAVCKQVFDKEGHLVRVCQECNRDAHRTDSGTVTAATRLPKYGGVRERTHPLKKGQWHGLKSRSPAKENKKKSHEKMVAAVQNGRVNTADEWHFQLQNKRFFVKLTEDGFIQVTGFAVKTYRKRPVGTPAYDAMLMNELKTRHGEHFKFGSANKIGCFISSYHAFKKTRNPNVWKRYNKSRAAERIRNNHGQNLRELVESVEV
jgi:hypothetical protein